MIASFITIVRLEALVKDRTHPCDHLLLARVNTNFLLNFPPFYLKIKQHKVIMLPKAFDIQPAPGSLSPLQIFSLSVSAQQPIISSEALIKGSNILIVQQSSLSAIDQRIPVAASLWLVNLEYLEYASLHFGNIHEYLQFMHFSASARPSPMQISF